MRRIVLMIFVVISLNLYVSNAQTMVVTTPQHTNVVLEEFTGINCGWCPEGHIVAQDLSNANPGRVVLVNIHAGGYATPGAGQPDYRTVFGEAIDNAMAVNGYPAGAINRRVFPEIGQAPAMSRSAWPYAAHQLFPTQSPVNVAFTSVFDTATRELSVAVELYYTQHSGTSSNYLQVALLENHVIGYQGGAGGSATYDHKHMLRWLLTGQWGLEIPVTTQGSVFADTITYTVPIDFNVNNCDVAVYVTESHFNVLTGVQAVAVGGSHDGSTTIYTGTLLHGGDNVAEGTVGTPSQFTATMESSLLGDEDFMVSLTSTNAPSDWTASFSVDGTDYTSTTSLSFSNYTPEDILVKITPGATQAMATYILELQSVSYPTAPARTVEFHVIRGITDLVVNSTGSWGNGGTYNFEQDYLDGLAYAGNQAYAITDGNVMTKAHEANALSGVNNIYMNVGWRFPSFTDDLANALMDFMDNGGNVFVAGQDIAWDIKSGDGYGTTVTSELFTDYMHASYVSDGVAANNQLTAVSADPIFGALSSSPIVDIFGGFIYPDQINVVNGGVPVFNYNSTSKVAGVRFGNSTYKMVYLCIDLAMVSDVAVRKEIIKTAHDYFYAPVSIENTDAFNNLSIYPNPSMGMVQVEMSSQEARESTIEVFELTGRKLLEIQLGKVKNVNRSIDLSSLSAGIYFIKIKSDDKESIHQIEVLK